MPGERDLVARLADKSDRLETATKVREAWNSASVVLAYVAALSIVLWIFPGPITLPFLWYTVAAWAVYTLVRVLFIRRRFVKRQRERDRG